MNITKYGMAEDSVLNYLPTESPPENLVSNTLRGVQLPLVTRHTLSWISAVAAEFERQAMWRHIRGYRFATYGLADTDYEYVGFAVLAYADPVAFGPDPTLDLKVANHVFRVFIRRGVLINQAPAIHPQISHRRWATRSLFWTKAAIPSATARLSILRNQGSTQYWWPLLPLHQIGRRLASHRKELPSTSTHTSRPSVARQSLSARAACQPK